jgi:hypothetical protein
MVCTVQLLMSDCLTLQDMLVCRSCISAASVRLQQELVCSCRAAALIWLCSHCHSCGQHPQQSFSTACTYPQSFCTTKLSMLGVWLGASTNMYPIRHAHKASRPAFKAVRLLPPSAVLSLLLAGARLPGSDPLLRHVMRCCCCRSAAEPG